MLKKYPFYLKSTVILFGLVLFVYAFANLKDIFVPLRITSLMIFAWFFCASAPKGSV